MWLVSRIYWPWRLSKPCCILVQSKVVAFVHRWHLDFQSRSKQRHKNHGWCEGLLSFKKCWQSFFNKFSNQVNGDFCICFVLEVVTCKVFFLDFKDVFNHPIVHQDKKRPVSERCGWALSSVGFPWVFNSMSQPGYSSWQTILYDQQPWPDGFQHHLEQKFQPNHSHGIRVFKSLNPNISCI